MPQDFFTNYESLKLAVTDPRLINLYIWLLLFGVTLFTIQRRETVFLDVTQTDQLRGIAILLIVVGHLWVHVSNNRPAIILSGEGVSLFLILSGFGLTRSQLKKPYTVRVFIAKRFRRLFFTYWMATILIIALDYVLLQRTYALSDILLTFIGVNIVETTKHIDYVRWFITFLIFWYGIFLLATRQERNRRFLLVLFGVSMLVFPLDYYVTRFGWYQIFSFFVGCFFGVHYDALCKVALKRKIVVAVIGIFGVIWTLSFNLLLSDLLKEHIPYLGFLFAEEVKSILFSTSVMTAGYFLGLCGKISRFLVFTGSLSYEIFLIHGVFLIKYNFFFTDKYLPLTFAGYLFFVVLLSIMLSKITGSLNLRNFTGWHSEKTG